MLSTDSTNRRAASGWGFEAWLDGLVNEDLEARILPFDIAAARLFGKLPSAWAQDRPTRMGDARSSPSRPVTAWPSPRATSQALPPSGSR
jgi:hypothetical protein